MPFKYVFLSIFLTFCIHANPSAQSLRGQVLDNHRLTPVQNVNIREGASMSPIQVDSGGYFEIDASAMPPVLHLTIGSPAHKTLEIDVFKEDWGIGIQTFYLLTVGELEEMVHESLQLDDDSDGDLSGDVYSLLASSTNPLMRAVGFEFSAFRTKLRGLGNAFDQLGFNGFLLNDLDYGRIPFSYFSGLSVITRASRQYQSYRDDDSDFGSAGVAQWITADPSLYRSEFSVNAALSNRNYEHRFGLHYASGIHKNGAAWTAGVSRRWSGESFVPGAFYDAWGAYLGYAKPLGAGHLVKAMFVYAPVLRGKSSPATQEVFDLSGDLYYNAYWGYQLGKKRNSREVQTSAPLATFNLDLQISNNARLELGVMGTYAHRSDGQLDWNNAPDPRPDYYQKLPSAIEDITTAERVRQRWTSDPSVSQIDWVGLYNANYLNVRTIQNVGGDSTLSLTGTQAVYFISQRISDTREFEHFGKLKWQNKRHRLQMLYRLEWSHSDNHLRLDDLLGADFALDVEDFIDDPAKQHPDISQMNRVVREGDQFGYHYLVRSGRYSLYPAYQYLGRHLDVSLGGYWQYNEFQREGKLQNAIFPTSFGKSSTEGSSGLGAKVLATWKISGRNYLQANMALQQLPNRFEQTFVNPEWRGDVFTNLANTGIALGDLSYYYRSPGLKWQLSAFAVAIDDQTVSKNFYLDDQLEQGVSSELADGSLVNAFYTGLDERHYGIEGSIELKLNSRLRVQAAGILGDYFYNSRPTLWLFDKFSTSSTQHTIYQRNYYVHGTAQQALSLGLRIELPGGGFATLTGNYLNKHFIELNPLRRIPEAVGELDPDSELFSNIIAQEELPQALYLNLFAIKYFRWLGQSFSASLSVNNLLDRRGLKSGGFEQYRFDYETRDPRTFPSKYYHFQGINYYLSLTARF